MVTVDHDVVEFIAAHDDYIQIDEFVRQLERLLPEERPGVPRVVVEAYADELGYDPERVRGLLEERVTDATTWQPGYRLYRVGENVSSYSASWHDRLDGATDFATYVSVMTGDIQAPPDVAVPSSAPGVTAHDLLDAAEIVGGIDRDRARSLLQRQRREGAVEMLAWQNPEDLVRLPGGETD